MQMKDVAAFAHLVVEPRQTEDGLVPMVVIVLGIAGDDGEPMRIDFGEAAETVGMSDDVIRGSILPLAMMAQAGESPVDAFEKVKPFIDFAIRVRDAVKALAALSAQ